jgi:hypothetical protein
METFSFYTVPQPVEQPLKYFHPSISCSIYQEMEMKGYSHLAEPHSNCVKTLNEFKENIK